MNPLSPKRPRLDPSASPPPSTAGDRPSLGNTDEDGNNCIICLQKVKDRVQLPCGHDKLCFECILTWTDQSRKCPLCSTHIGEYLIHHVRSKHDYQKHWLLPLKTSPPPPTTRTERMRSRAAAGPMGRRRREPVWGRREESRLEMEDELERAINKRKWVYRNGLYAKHVASNIHTKYRPCPTPAQFAASQDLITRTTAFLRREFRVWNDLDVEFLTGFTLSLMRSIDIRSESAIKLLAEFLDMDTIEGRKVNAEHFAHELYSYLRSPFRELAAYDAVVQYDPPVIQQQATSTKRSTRISTPPKPRSPPPPLNNHVGGSKSWAIRTRSPSPSPSPLSSSAAARPNNNNKRRRSTLSPVGRNTPHAATTIKEAEDKLKHELEMKRPFHGNEDKSRDVDVDVDEEKARDPSDKEEEETIPVPGVVSDQQVLKAVHDPSPNPGVSPTVNPRENKSTTRVPRSALTSLRAHLSRANHERGGGGGGGGGGVVVLGNKDMKNHPTPEDRNRARKVAKTEFPFSELLGPNNDNNSGGGQGDQERREDEAPIETTPLIDDHEPLPQIQIDKTTGREREMARVSDNLMMLDREKQLRMYARLRAKIVAEKKMSSFGSSSLPDIIGSSGGAGSGASGEDSLSIEEILKAKLKSRKES